MPTAVAELLTRLAAPPRLAAHLRLVHDAAHQLLDGLAQQAPELSVDREAVLFGAATHDIGKVCHPAELSGPGSQHERAGQELLLSHGFPPELARFAATHGDWAGADRTIEDLLVSMADKVWKGRRVADLEDLLLDRLTGRTGGERWTEYLALDDLLSRIGEAADRRLAFQAAFPL
ncbi:phosphohydrolase [Streptomyces tateyamensis]|uniref:Phosphohydrolase n=1 Tax=Streptomyces tateyamensis TaxID=565073 RepID=A0A2V4P1R6_9ACTN|nr:phosphohydrolase [Streptomyces tateyamensis]